MILLLTEQIGVFLLLVRKQRKINSNLLYIIGIDVSDMYAPVVTFSTRDRTFAQNYVYFITNAVTYFVGISWEHSISHQSRDTSIILKIIMMKTEEKTGTPFPFRDAQLT